MYHLSIDMGASSCKMNLGQLKDGELILKEVHRFDDYLLNENSELHWDIDKILKEIRLGLDKLVEISGEIVSIGVDTWGVDFVLLDRDKKICAPVMSYRDDRTKKIIDEVFNLIPIEELYERTGIQHQSFNSIFQLYYLKKYHPDLLNKAEYFLMLPDYISYALGGDIINEYTNASTTQLLNIKNKSWDLDLIGTLGIPKKIFQPIKMPGDFVGKLKHPNWKGLTEIIAVASHDTASAIIAAPTRDSNYLFLSSGTWSLLGRLIHDPIINKESRDLNYTNEAGLPGTIRFIKNIMGLWIVQRLKAENAKEMTFEEIDSLVRNESNEEIFNVNDPRLLSPESMTDAVKEILREDYKKSDYNIGELFRIAYKSLALSYAKAIKEINVLTKSDDEIIYVVGGGSQSAFLNEQITNTSALEISIGPTEASSIGNLMIQMLAMCKEIQLENLKETLQNSGYVRRITNDR